MESEGQAPVDVERVMRRIDEIDRELLRLVPLRQERADLVRFLQMAKHLFDLDIGDLADESTDENLRRLLRDYRDRGGAHVRSAPSSIGEVVERSGGTAREVSRPAGAGLAAQPPPTDSLGRPALSEASHVDAILWVLITFADARHGMSNSEILDALVSNGWQTTAEDPMPVIRSTLNRLLHDELIERVARGRYAVAPRLRHSANDARRALNAVREASTSRHAN